MVRKQLVPCRVVPRASFMFFQRASMIVSGLTRVFLYIQLLPKSTEALYDVNSVNVESSFSCARCCFPSKSKC